MYKDSIENALVAECRKNPAKLRKHTANGKNKITASKQKYIDRLVKLYLMAHTGR
jgi:hypothetical protein